MQSSPRRYLLTSVVYIAAVLLLLCLAVFAGSFSKTVGGTRVSGRYSPLPLFNRNSLEALTLSWNGLDLRFSRVTDPGLRRLETADGTADIVLAGDARLRLSSPDERGSALTISQVATGAPAAEVLTIPFRVSGLLQSDTGANMLSWREGGRAFQLSLPSDARIDYSARTIRLRLGAALPVLRLVSLSPAVTAPRVAAARLPDEKSLPTREQLAASVARFSDSAYAGWSMTRYSANGGTWKMADGRQGFAEGIGIGLLAESVARGTFADVVRVWNNALDSQLGRNPALPLSQSTCVYTGRVRDFAGRLQDRDPAEIERLKGLAAHGDVTLADRRGVLLYLLNRGGPALARTALSSLRALDAARLSLPQRLTLLESLEDYAQHVGDDASVPQAAQDLIEKLLLPSLAATSDGKVFLCPQSPGSVDVSLSLRCGSLLVRAGSLFQDSFTGALGRGLIVSSLSLATDGGFLPATVSLASGRITSRDGLLPPESVYTMLPTGRHVPREVPLYRLMGSSCWVWTAADLLSAQRADNEVRLVFSYPAGVPHYLVFRGLRPFSQIRLHGIPWHADPDYAKYSDGWAYDEQNRTLFMKITGRQDREEVDFGF